MATYMAVNEHARVEDESLSEPMSFRHLQSRRVMLEAFMRADGLDSLTPILREAIDFYIAERLRRGKVGVRSDAPMARSAVTR